MTTSRQLTEYIASAAAVKPLVQTQGPTGIGTANDPAQFKHIIPIYGAATGVGTSNGQILETAQKSLAGAATGVGTSTGELTHTMQQTGASTGVGTSAGTFTVRNAITGAATGIGTAAGTLRRKLPQYGAATGIGTSNGTNALSKTATEPLIKTTNPTGIGTSAGTMRLRKFITNTTVPSVGRGTSAGTLGLNGGALTWTPAFGTLFTPFTPTWFHQGTVHTYCALIKCTSGTVKTRLFNITDGGAVSGSEITIPFTTGLVQEVESTGLTLPAAEKNYRAEIAPVAGGTGTIYRGRFAHKGV